MVFTDRKGEKQHVSTHILKRLLCWLANTFNSLTFKKKF